MTEAAPSLRGSDRRFILAATILGSAMAFIDGSVVVLALPSIERDLAVGFDALQWVSTAYLLTLSALVVVGGALGDRFGRRRIFTLGVWVFGLASIACAVAPTGEALIVARAAKGVGAALLIPQSLGILAASFGPDERGGAIGLWASASALTTAAGPAVGGLLVEALGWRSVFWINAPLAAATLALAYLKTPESRAAAVAGPPDWLGAATLTLGLGAGVWALIEAPVSGAAAPVLVAALASLGALAVFAGVQRRAAAPIAPPQLFDRPAFNAAMTATFGVYAALGGALFLLPLDLTARSGHSAAQVGYVIGAFALVIGSLSTFAGRLTSRWGARPLVAGGAAGLGAALVLLALAPPGAGYPSPASVLVALMGLSMAACAAPISTATMNAAPNALAGAASGLSNGVSRVAGLFAVAAVGALTAAVFQIAGGSIDETQGLAAAIARPPSDPAVLQALDLAFGAGYVACAAMAFGGALAALSLPGEPGCAADAPP